jgi:uncharacterized membrane protein
MVAENDARPGTHNEPVADEVAEYVGLCTFILFDDGLIVLFQYGLVLAWCVNKNNKRA